MLRNILFPLLAILMSRACCNTNFDREVSLMETLSYLLEDEYSFNLGDSDSMEEIAQVFQDHGYDAEKLLADGIASSLISLFTSERKMAFANFAIQISCYQGRSTNLLTAGLYGYKRYNGYGCYCGGGIYNGNFLDATDRCCKIHDHCYSKAQKLYKMENGCHTYTTPYTVSCCARKKITKCKDKGPSAGRALCECDQQMAECVAKSLPTFNKDYMKYKRQKCLDTSKTTKTYSFFDILKSCKYFKKPRKEPENKNVKSQGNCPVRKRRWW